MPNLTWWSWIGSPSWSAPLQNRKMNKTEARSCRNVKWIKLNDCSLSIVAVLVCVWVGVCVGVCVLVCVCVCVWCLWCVLCVVQICVGRKSNSWGVAWFGLCEPPSHGTDLLQDRPPPDRPPPDRPPRDRPKFRFFFPSPAPIFVLFFSLWGPSREILKEFLKTGTLKCACLGSRTFVWNPDGFRDVGEK